MQGLIGRGHRAPPVWNWDHRFVTSRLAEWFAMAIDCYSCISVIANASGITIAFATYHSCQENAVIVFDWGHIVSRHLEVDESSFHYSRLRRPRTIALMASLDIKVHGALVGVVCRVRIAEFGEKWTWDTAHRAEVEPPYRDNAGLGL